MLGEEFLREELANRGGVPLFIPSCIGALIDGEVVVILSYVLPHFSSFLPVCLSFYLSIYLSIYLSFLSFFLSFLSLFFFALFF